MRVVVSVVLVVVFAAVVAAVALVTGSDKWVTVVVASGAAIAVTWQSYETRRAASAGEKALRGGADSLRVSQVLAIEAERRRLDAEAPRLLVRINEAEWPPRVGANFVGSEPAQLPQKEKFRLPKDGTRLLTMRADGFIRNEGDRIVRVSLHGMRVHDKDAMSGPRWEPQWTEPGNHNLDIAPDTVEQFRFEDVRSAREWIANTEAAERNEAAPSTGIGVVVANDGNDNGIIDTWEVEIAGRPFVRIGGEDGGWQLHHDTLTGKGPMVAQVWPKVRSYWRSKQRQQKLPEVDLPVSSADAPARP